MSLNKHEHCSICTKAYSTKNEAEKCFWGHSEIEKLRWIANEVHNIKNWRSEELGLYDLNCELFNKIDKITEDYNIKDTDY